MKMCEDIAKMESRFQEIRVLFDGLGKDFHEQDDAAEKIEKEIKGHIGQKVNQSIRQKVNQSINQSVNQSQKIIKKQSVIQSVKKPFNQTVRKSVKNQSVSQ